MRHAKILLGLVCLLFASVANSQDRHVLVDSYDIGEEVRQLAEEILLYIPNYEPKDEHQTAFEATHRELYTTDAVICYFGGKNCPPCVPQKAILKGQVGKYNIVFYDVADKKAKEVLDHFKLDHATPQIVIAKKGEKVHAFRGFTPWSKIEAVAAPALKVPPKKTKIDIGPIHIDVDGDKVDVDIGPKKETRRQRRRRIRNDRFGALDFEGLRALVVEWFEVGLAWTLEHWDTIVKVLLLVIAL